MKKSLLLLLLCAGILTGCGNQTLPAEPTEISTVSQTTSAVQAAEQSTTTTTTITEGIPEVTETCSEVIPTVTTVTETTITTESIPNDTESTTTTAAVQEEESSEAESITSKPTVTNKVTTTTKAVATTNVSTTRKPTTTAKPVTTTKATTTTTVTTPSRPVITDDNLYGYYFDISDKLNDPVLDWTKVTLQVGLFIEQYPIDYQEMYEKGATFTGSDLEKARAILNYAYNLGGQNCIEYALNAYFLYQGAGLHAEITFESHDEWYGHVANVVEIEVQWMTFDASAGKYSANSYSTIKAFDVYENTVIIQ